MRVHNPMNLRLIRDKYIQSWSTRMYKIEYNGFFSNHLVHALVALCELGASESKIESFAEQYVQKLCVADTEAEPVCLEESKLLLGKREKFNGLRVMYEDEVETLGVDGAVKKYLPSLVGGLAGSLLHGIIQLGYGYHLGGALPVAEGLAYMHYSYLSFENNKDSCINAVGKQTITRETVLPLLRKIYHDEVLIDKLHHHLKEPFIQGRTQSNLQRRLMCFSSDPIIGNPVLFDAVSTIVNDFSFSNVDATLALDFSLWLYDTVPKNDFVVLHAVTSAWSLQKVERLLSASERVRIWKIWFHIAISALISHEVPDLPSLHFDANVAELPEWDSIIEKVLHLGNASDEHMFKLAQVARDHATCVTNSTFLSRVERDFLMKKAVVKVLTEDVVFEANGISVKW